MKKTLPIILIFFLVFSFTLNVYLYKRKEYFKVALTNQFLATADIEKLLKGMGADLSFQNVRYVAENDKFLTVKQVTLPNNFPKLGADKTALIINDTLILFKNGIYYGSSANYPTIKTR